jgi:hypothetical protein
MTDRSILYRIRAALQGSFVAVAEEIQLLASYVGLFSGANNTEAALRLVDGTGLGARVRPFVGSYAAQSTNIDDWFGGRQRNRLRCTSNGGISPVIFTLPGTTALNTAFDTLAANNLEEILVFIIEYTGPSSAFLRIIPRPAPSPQIQATSSIIVRSGVAATVEISRTQGVISSYIFSAIAPIGEISGSDLDAIKLVRPADAVWDASTNGLLPSVGVVKGNAYLIVNAPSDGSGRFNEVMLSGDRAVWQGETFTSWSAEPHQWFVLSAHEVRRISALEQDFLNNVVESPVSDRNTVIRGAIYADEANEIRLKIYPTAEDYTPADLNTTGDIDAYTDPTTQTGRLAIRLPGLLSANVDILPRLYVYVEHNSTFTRVFNMADDFTHQGDFTTESDYLSNENINYVANDILRVYVGTIVERFRVNNFDVTEEDLVDEVQRKLNRTDSGGSFDQQRIATLESKVGALFPLTPDVDKLTSFADIYTPDVSVATVSITSGYSLLADYRGSGDRYESTGVTYDDTGTNVVLYSGLTENLHRFFGFKVSAPANQVVMWLLDGATRIPYIDITSAGNIRINSYRDVTTDGVPVSDQLHFLTLTSGDTLLQIATNSVSTFTITPFPAGATDTSRRMSFFLDIYIGGQDTEGEGGVEISLPADNTAQVAQELQRTVYLGPLHGNRTVSVTISYTLRVSGSDLLIDFRLVAADPDVTVRIDSTAVYLSYTPAATTSRVDNFVNFESLTGVYIFTGPTDFIISFQPQQGFQNAVGGAVDTAGAVTLFNDINVPIPPHDFASVEIPDTIEFRTALPDHFLRHNDIGALLPRRGTRWVYGLALLQSVTEQSIEAVPHITTGTAVPAIIPNKVGDIFVKTTAPKTIYIATGTASTGDWTEV